MNEQLIPMADQTYRDICVKACEWCAKGIRLSHSPSSGLPIHIVHVDVDPAGNTTEYEFCTAPTKDAVIERLSFSVEAQLAILKKVKDCLEPNSGDTADQIAARAAATIERLAGELRRKLDWVRVEKDAVIERLVTELEQANTLIRLTYEEYEKAIAENPVLSGLGPYDGNPLKAWHGLYGWLMDSAKQMAMKLETISKYASRTAGELKRVRKEAAKLGHESGCASHRTKCAEHCPKCRENTGRHLYLHVELCNCAQSRIQVKP